MKLKKKLIVAATGVLCVFALAACSKDEAVVSMKGEKITQSDVYTESKASASSTFQQVIQQTVIYGAFSNVYGDKVSDDDVDDAYKSAAEANGGTDGFKTVLTQYGYTEKSYKKILKQTLAFQEGLKAYVKLTDDDLETAWESYHPEVEAQIITTASEDDAKAALEAIKGGTDFAEVAKDQSTDTTTKEDGGTVKFDSTDTTTVPADVQTAAYALKDGEVSDIVTVAGTYSSTYYIVKMTKNVDKGNSMDKYEKEIKEIATDTKTNDSTFQNTVIKKVLKKANVKILDDDLNQYFTDYLGTDSTSSSAATSSDATATSSSAATTTSSSAATTTSSSAATTTSTTK